MLKSAKRIINRHLPNSEFVRNALTLVSGTTIAQAIPILISPILTRLYSPEEFGTYGLFIGLLSILGVVCTGRYEIAIMLPKSDDEARKVVKLPLLLSALTSLVCFIPLFAYSKEIASLLGNPNIEPFLLLIPLGVFLAGWFSTFNYWSNRKNHYGKMANAKMTRSVSSSTSNILFGILRTGVSGLVISNLLGQIVEVAILSLKYFKETLLLNNTTKFQDLKTIALRYKKFPQYSLSAAALNTASLQLPILLLTQFANATETGFYFQAHKILSLPMSVIGSAIGQVFFQKASTNAANQKYIADLTFDTFQKLLFIGVVPMGLITVFGDHIFAFVFGADWRMAGVYAQILSPWLLLVFIFSPISVITYILEKQEIGLVINFVIFLIRFLSLSIGFIFFDNFIVIIGIFGFSSFFTRFFVGIYLMHLAKANMQKVLKVLFCSLLLILGLLSLIRFSII